MRKIGKNTLVCREYDGTGVSVIADKLLADAWQFWRKLVAGL